MNETASRRLVIVSHSREHGGAEVYVENLIRHLALDVEKRWAPELICRRDQEVDRLAHAAAEYGPVFRLDFTSPIDVAAIARHLRGASLVHLNLSFPTGKYPFGSAVLARALGRPLVVTHHLALRVGTPWRQMMRWLGRSAVRHIAVSDYAARALLIDYAYSRDRLRIIHNGVDPEIFRPADTQARLAFRKAAGQRLEQTEWDDDIVLVCTVARLSTQKGLFELVDAASQAAEVHPNLRFVVLGEGPLRARLAETIKRRRLERKLFLLGARPRKEVAAWLAASDLLLMASHYEGGPATAVMEAMAAGCAVVATDVSGVRELVSDDTIGRLVPTNDAAALASAVSDLAANRELRASMARRAREKVLGEFTIDVCMGKTMQVLDEAVATPR